jgi:hypothetical protein
MRSGRLFALGGETISVTPPLARSCSPMSPVKLQVHATEVSFASHQLTKHPGSSSSIRPVPGSQILIRIEPVSPVE